MSTLKKVFGLKESVCTLLILNFQTKQSYYKAVREAEAAKSVLDESTSSKVYERRDRVGMEDKTTSHYIYI